MIAANYQVGQEAMQQLTQETFSRYFLDSSQLMDTIKHFLRGEEMVEEKTMIDGQETLVAMWRVRKNTEGKALPPPINDYGYNYTIWFMSPLMDKAISGSNLDEEKASMLTLENINNLTITYYENYTPFNVFGFNSEAEMLSIVGQLLTLIFSQLQRAVGMETLKQLNAQHSIVEQRIMDKSPMQQQQLRQPMGLSM